MTAIAETFEITIFTKNDGPLTKQISLTPDGTIKSDGSACVMSCGSARRVKLGGVGDLAHVIDQMRSSEALALGRLRKDLPDQVEVVTKRGLEKINGAARPDIIARTGNDIVYRSGQPAFALLDFDTKGMPDEVSARLDERGGFWPTLVSVIPELAPAARVQRSSTSAGRYRTDTGEELAGSSGMHTFVAVLDGRDIDRFLKTLHARCWLAGFGWLIVGAGGQLLERSTVDRVVGSPERLVFEGPPIVLPPLAQDSARRGPSTIDGVVLDSVAVSPPLGIVEQHKFAELRAKEAHRLAPEIAEAKGTVYRRAEPTSRRQQRHRSARARRIVGRQCSGVLLPDVVLPFDDPELAGVIVADVLAEPLRFESATLADPLEGPEYGVCKARIMRRADGSPWIHSFAHGRTVYELKYDARGIEAALAKAPTDGLAELFARLVIAADLEDDQVEQLRNIVCDRSGLGKRALAAKLKAARQEHNDRQSREEQQRRLAERNDPRPRLVAPLADAERLPIVTAIDDVLASLAHPEPPMRDAGGRPVEVQDRVPIMLHALLENETDADEADATSGPGDAAADAA